MKKYIIDTNALISFVTDRNPEQQKKLAALFESVAQLECQVLCHQHVLTEFVYVMDKVYNVSKRDIKMMIRDFMSLPGIEIVHSLDIESMLAYWPEAIADFGDAVIASLGKNIRGAAVITFDHKLSANLKKLGISTHSF